MNDTPCTRQHPQMSSTKTETKCEKIGIKLHTTFEVERQISRGTSNLTIYFSGFEFCDETVKFPRKIIEVKS